MDDLKLCYDAMDAKRREQTLRWRYYDGDHPLRFTNPKMSEVIPNGVVFRKNWCQVIINTTRDRLRIQEWASDKEADAEAMAQLWERVLRRNATRIHVAMLTTGEAFLIAWPKKDGKPGAYYHDPRQAHVVYEDDDPDTPRVACKRWVEGKAHKLNLYYPERIEHYGTANEPSTAEAFVIESTDPNPYGVIPVFHFRADHRVCFGELTPGVLSLQDAMNKLLNDMMVSSEYSSFPQRWGIGHWEEGKLPVGPGTILKIPGGQQGDQPANVGTFDTTDPGNYLQPIDSMANDMAVLSGTPRHYFTGTSANISGEALQAMEGPLVAKLEMYHEALGPIWAQAMAFCMDIQGASVAHEEIEVLWQPPHTVQPMSQAQTRLTNTQAGIPIINLLRDEGWDEEQLDQLLEDAAAMIQAAPASASAASASPGPQNPGPQNPGPQGSVDDQAAMQQVTIDRQSTAIQAALLTALEAVNVELVDKLRKSGALERMRAT